MCVWCLVFLSDHVFWSGWLWGIGRGECARLTAYMVTARKIRNAGLQRRQCNDEREDTLEGSSLIRSFWSLLHRWLKEGSGCGIQLKRRDEEERIIGEAAAIICLVWPSHLLEEVHQDVAFDYSWSWLSCTNPRLFPLKTHSSTAPRKSNIFIFCSHIP